MTSIGRDYAREQSGSCKAYTDGKVIDIPADTRGGITPAYPKDLKTVDAVFIKNNAREYGMVQLFAAGSATSGGNRPNVRQPIAGWFGLTFCKEDEFEALARKWVDVRGDIDVE